MSSLLLICWLALIIVSYRGAVYALDKLQLL